MIPVGSARVRSVLPILLCAALGACGSKEGPAAPPASGTGIELFLEPAKGLRVEPGLALDELLERYTQRMGWSLLVSAELRAKLEERHCTFDQELALAPASVHGFVETLVRENGLLLRFEHASAPVVLQVIDPGDKEQGDIPAHRVLVPVAELPRWESHPAHMITTQVALPAGDAETLVRSLRAIFGEAARGQVMQTGDTHSILFSGTGAEVARLARILGDATRAAGTPDALPPAQIERTQWIELLRAPPKGLHLEDSAQKGIPLYDLLQQYTQLMGWRVLAGPDTWNMLRVLRCSFALPVDVPAENVHSFVEGVLCANDFVLSFAHAQDPVLLEVRSTNVAGRGNPRMDAVFIPSAELPRWAAHPGFLVSTVVDLPGVDVRTLSNSLRQMFSDQQTQQIIPLGNTDGLLVTGFGSDVAALGTMFRTLVDAAAGAHGPPPVPLAAGPEIELFVTPPKGLHLEKPGKGELRLADLFEAYAQLMGWRVLAGGDVSNQLRTLRCGFALPVDVPAGHVHAFVESVARANDFVLSFAHAKDPVLLQIDSTNVGGRGNPRKDALRVPVADLPRWAAHPDFLITTLIDLPGVDVRTLSNSLRQMFSDQQTQQIIPVGNTDGLIVTGFGSDVAGIVALFRTLVDAAAGAHAALPAPLAVESVIGLLVPPSKGLHLEQPEGRKLKLIDLFDQYAQLMGWRVLADPDTRNQLVTLDCGFKLPVDVPAEGVHAFVEGFARANGFVLGFVHAREPVLLRIESLRVAGKGDPKGDAAFVPAAELARWAAHPAFLITTCVDLPGIDVRTLSNSLRQQFSDQQTQEIIPLGDSNGLVLTGFATDVVSLVSSLGELSRGGAGLQPTAALAPPAADRARLFPLGGESFTIAAPDGKEAVPIDVLEEFASWTKRPLEISDEARKALAAVERHFAEPRVVPAQLAYPCVGLLLERAHCTLSPVPPAAPVKWVVDVVRSAKGVAASDVPTIPFEEVAAWSAYCATPFRTFLKLPDSADSKQVDGVLRTVAVGGVGCRVDFAGNRALQLCGTPLEIQATAYAILQACEPAPEKPR